MYALSLFALVGIAGVAFDYARVAGMDSELQNGADQAALAGATQLDHEDGACSRAANAAIALLNNSTLLANDNGGLRVNINGGSSVGAGNDSCTGISGVTFYQDRDKTNVATTDEDARFIEVAVDDRVANYAFTPIVGAFFGDISAKALAGLGSSVCKVPPVMICNPSESTDPDFTIANYVGKGLKLVSVGNGSGSWAPGNFGYLDTQAGANGAPGLRQALGWESAPGDCIAATGVDTKPGATVTVTDALNTRFDIYNTNVSCPTGGACPASINSLKDVQRPHNANTGNGCSLKPQGWQLPSGYYGSTPVSATVPLSTSVIPTAMGHPRDMCHLADSTDAGYCGGPVGNGVWDRDTYFRTNYVRSDGSRWTSSDWQNDTGLPSDATRYAVYSWEIDHRGEVIDGVTVLGAQPSSATGNTLQAYGEPVCSSAQGYGSGIVPGGAIADRRKISVAVVNCTAQDVKGNSTDVPVKKWIDVFLVEPSLNRALTNNGEVYVEVIGETSLAGGGSAEAQTIRRDVPYLVQ
jgi:Flp pilus assembly protein TadG